MNRTEAIKTLEPFIPSLTRQYNRWGAENVNKSKDRTWLYRDEYYDFDTEKKGIVELNVDRCVRSDRGLAEILWLPQFMTFANLERS